MYFQRFHRVDTCQLLTKLSNRQMTPNKGDMRANLCPRLFFSQHRFRNRSSRCCGIHYIYMVSLHNICLHFDFNTIYVFWLMKWLQLLRVSIRCIFCHLWFFYSAFFILAVTWFDSTSYLAEPCRSEMFGKSTANTTSLVISISQLKNISCKNV